VTHLMVHLPRSSQRRE